MLAASRRRCGTLRRCSQEFLLRQGRPLLRTGQVRRKRAPSLLLVRPAGESYNTRDEVSRRLML